MTLIHQFTTEIRNWMTNLVEGQKKGVDLDSMSGCVSGHLNYWCNWSGKKIFITNVNDNDYSRLLLLGFVSPTELGGAGNDNATAIWDDTVAFGLSQWSWEDVVNILNTLPTFDLTIEKTTLTKLLYLKKTEYFIYLWDIDVTVVDETDIPIQNVNVVLDNGAPVLTDINGVSKFEGVEEGEHTIEALESVYFASDTDPGKPNTLTFTLTG